MWKTVEAFLESFLDSGRSQSSPLSEAFELRRNDHGFVRFRFGGSCV
jgi:hypothetical protein